MHDDYPTLSPRPVQARLLERPGQWIRWDARLIGSLGSLAQLGYTVLFDDMMYYIVPGPPAFRARRIRRPGAAVRALSDPRIRVHTWHKDNPLLSTLHRYGYRAVPAGDDFLTVLPVREGATYIDYIFQGRAETWYAPPYSAIAHRVAEDSIAANFALHYALSPVAALMQAAFFRGRFTGFAACAGPGVGQDVTVAARRELRDKGLLDDALAQMVGQRIAAGQTSVDSAAREIKATVASCYRAAARYRASLAAPVAAVDRLRFLDIVRAETSGDRWVPQVVLERAAGHDKGAARKVLDALVRQGTVLVRSETGTRWYCAAEGATCV
jgi:hypothetical protein